MRVQPAAIAKWFLGCVVLALLAMILSTCGSDDTASPPATDEAPVAQDFSGRGPYVVSATRLQLDAERPVEVLYPAADDPVPADARPYEITPEETWGSFLDLLPAGTVRTLEIPEAWFDLAPSTDGDFPLVVISHGFGVERFTHAASAPTWRPGASSSPCPSTRPAICPPSSAATSTSTPGRATPARSSTPSTC